MELNIDRSFFNEAYVPYLLREERYQVFYGGAGSGKSYFLANNLIIELLQEKQKLLVVRQVFATIRDSVYAELLSALERMSLLPHVKISKTTFNIKFPNGSEIIFKGADDESKLLSISGIDLVWIEEASDISKDLFNQLELRLRGGSVKKKFYLSFNPISERHWLKEEFFANPKPDSFVSHTTYLDNRFLDAAYIETLEDMKERNFSKYEVYALGKWGSVGKSVFENWHKKEFEVADIVRTHPNIVEAYGLDFGFVADPSTLVCLLVDVSQRKLYVFDELYEKGLLNNQLASKIVEKGYGAKPIIADSAEQKSIAELRRYGIRKVSPAKKGKGSILHGLQYIQQFEIIVHPSCENFIHELEHYSYKKDRRTGEFLETPIDDYNHLIDAMRYALEPFSVKRISGRPITKGMLGL